MLWSQALALARAQDDPENITIHGELVHNETVLAELAARGFALTREDERQALPGTDNVLITAHGISDRERDRLEAGGRALLDTTCPLVRKAHRSALILERWGYHVIVIGRRGHVEVRGLTEDLGSFDIVGSPSEVARYAFPKLGVVAQTTTMEEDVQRILAAIRERNHHAELRFLDTVCEPTKQRIIALDDLITKVECVVVIGGRNSNNTRQLVRRCEARGIRAVHVQSPDDIDSSWFDGCTAVGVTAGTSTTDEMIEAVHARLIEIASRSAATR